VKARLQQARGGQRVVGLLRRHRALAVHQQRLRVAAHDLLALAIRLSIGSVTLCALVQHVSRFEALAPGSCAAATNSLKTRNRR
jgi:hypothetical protein